MMPGSSYLLFEEVECLLIVYQTHYWLLLKTNQECPKHVSYFQKYQDLVISHLMKCGFIHPLSNLLLALA